MGSSICLGLGECGWVWEEHFRLILSVCGCGWAWATQAGAHLPEGPSLPLSCCMGPLSFAAWNASAALPHFQPDPLSLLLHNLLPPFTKLPFILLVVVLFPYAVFYYYHNVIKVTLLSCTIAGCCMWCSSCSITCLQARQHTWAPSTPPSAP